MMKYKHTQVGYLILLITLAVLAFFIWVYLQAASEPPSPDSGPNLAITSVMALIVFILASFVTLQVVVDSNYLRIRFGYGIYQKKFLLHDITSVKTVKNRWYYGWGIRVWFWPKMLIYNVSGFDAVEIELKGGKKVRIGTNEPQKLEKVIRNSMK